MLGATGMPDRRNAGGTARFEIKPTADTHFGWLRTRMSVERTLMSAVRTAVALIGFGFTVTGYVTLAELPPDPQDYSGALPHMLYAGSLVFVKPSRPVGSDDLRHWWTFLRGADWRHPQGPQSRIDDRWRHPVVHVAYCDAVALARWAGKGVADRSGVGICGAGWNRARCLCMGR